ncbi:MAG: protein veg [Firmicutes bacterium]|nr:protein veg [Bacillota bacterium]
MNIDLVRQKIMNNLNKKVKVTVHGLRNKVSRYEGVLYKTYPNIFSIIEDGVEKSFSYNDYITGDVKIKFL